MSELRVFGGEGGIEVFTSHLDTEATLVGSAAEKVDSAGSSALGWSWSPSAFGVDGYLRPGQAEILRSMAQRVGMRLAASAKELRELAFALTSSAQGYRDAEEHAKAHPGGAGAREPGAQAAPTPRGIVLPHDPGMTFDGRPPVIPDALAELIRGMRAQAPPGIEVTAAAVAGLAAATAPGRAAIDARVAAVTGLVDAVAPAGPIVTGEASSVADAPGGDSLAGLVGLQGRAWEGQGQLIYTKVTTGHGETWVVTIPGTQPAEGGVWGTGRIPEAMSNKTENVSAAVLAGLAKVGASPGSRVVLNGHSQGGRHALNLASDPVLTARYRVSGVVTAGAPSGTDPTPEGIAVIQLEDPDDMVPGLDGAASVPTSKDRLLVRSAPAASQHRVEGEDPGVLGWEHKVANYRDLARAADADQGRSLGAAVSALGLKGGTSVSYQVPTSPAPPKRQPKHAPGLYAP